MKLRIYESGYNRRKYNLISKEEYDYWFNVGVDAFNNGEGRMPMRNKEVYELHKNNPCKIGSVENKRHSQITDAWIDGWTYANLQQPL